VEGAHSHIRYKVESAITLAPSACFNRRLTVAAWALKCTVLRYMLNVVLRRLMLYVVTEVCVAAMVWLARLDEPLLHRIEETRVSAADIPQALAPAAIGRGQCHLFPCTWHMSKED
jgi:hypothetical protein